MPDLKDLSNLDDNKELVESKQKEIIKLPDMDEPYTFEDLQKYWNQFARSLEVAGKINISTTLKGSTLQFENHVIKLGLNTDLQRELINDVKEELMTYIRQNLKNTKVMLETYIMEVQQGKRLYTQQEKYEFLEEKFPAIKDLKKRLGLEIGF